MDFLQSMITQAKANKQTIVLPESFDIRTIKAAEMVLNQGIANVVLLGDKDEVLKFSQGHDISGAMIIDPKTSDKLDDFSNTFYEIRKNKGVTLGQARDTMKDPLYFGVMMVKKGIAGGMVAGAANSTANVLRPSLQILKTAPGTKLVSSFMIMTVPDCKLGEDGLFFFSDIGLVENPTSEELAEIAISSAKSFETLIKSQPRVAMLSYSTHGSAKNPLVDKVVEASRIAKEKAPELVLDGEMQADAAIISSVAASKAPNSPVGGNANVLIFPDLNSGNISYKLVERLARAQAFGPITQGIAKPVNDLSRGCKAEDIVGVVAVTCVQAQAQV